MSSELDDLFDVQDIAHSRHMTDACKTLIESETLLDRILGSRFFGVPVHTGIGNVEALVKAFQEAGDTSRPVPATPVLSYRPEPVYSDDALAGLMDESDRHVGRELLKGAPAQPRQESRHFKPIVKIVAQLRSDLRKHYSEKAMKEAEEHWLALVKSAMDLVQASAEQA